MSEERLAVIGNSASIRSILSDWHGLADLLRCEPMAVITQFDRRLELMAAECPAGHYPGIECWLLAFVQFGDAAASGLTDVLERVPRQPSDAHSQPDAALPFKERRVGLSIGQPGGQVHVISISPSEIATKAAAYRSAARRWASIAQSVTADVEGKDSPAYAVWCAALSEHGCWTEESAGGMAAGGRRTFVELWSEAGLCQQESGSSPASRGAKSTGMSSSTADGKTFTVNMPYISVKYE